MYTRANLVERPASLDEEIVFHSVDKAILEDTNKTYNGKAAIESITELTWEKTWQLSVAESYMGLQFDHLGYTAPVYTDLNEFSCAFYRPFSQHTREYPDYGENELTTATESNDGLPTLRGGPDVIQLKVGSKLLMQLGYEKMYENESGIINGEQIKQRLIL